MKPSPWVTSVGGWRDAPAPAPAWFAAGLLLCCAAACSAPRAPLRAASGLRTSAATVGAQEGAQAEEGDAQMEPVQDAGEQSDAAGTEGGEKELSVRGSLSTRYRYRSDGGSDHDLTNTLSLHVGDADEQPATLHLLAWANADLGGSRGQDDPFFDINDTYSKDVTARLYEAYVDLHRIEELGLLRAGRQPLYETPAYVNFDGLRLESAPLGDKDLRLGAYGGIPVHHFESSSEGDSLAGTYLDLRPWEHGRARLDYMHLEDENLLGEHQNDLFGAQVWQNVGEKLRLEGAYTLLEGESRDLRGSAAWYELERDLVLRASYYELFDTQRELVEELDPFFASLRQYEPFREARLIVAKGFLERYHLELGGQVRRLREDQDEGLFNRDFERYYARFVLEDCLIDDLDLGLVAELLDAGEGEYSSWSADLERRWDERWKSVVGTFYALYDFDLTSLRERNDVRVYFLDLAFRASDNTRLGARYEFEDDDLDDYHVLRVGLTWRF